jgi:hypothetical protein
MRTLLTTASMTFFLASTAALLAQESNAAKATRKSLQQLITVEFKEEGTKSALEQVFGEIDKPPRFKIDNASGVSNNTKVSFKAEKKSAEQVLNGICDKLDCGWYVVSNAANNKVDGMVIIRKSTKGKERGYEAGKEPK